MVIGVQNRQVVGFVCLQLRSGHRAAASDECGGDEDAGQMELLHGSTLGVGGGTDSVYIKLTDSSAGIAPRVSYIGEDCCDFGIG